MSLLDLFLSDETRQNYRIADAAQAAADARFYGKLTEASVEQLRTQVMAQREQIIELWATVGVLTAILQEAGVVDPQILRYRVEAALAEHAEAARPENQTTNCTRCGSTVAMTQTTYSSDGEIVCDRCAAG